MGRLENFIPEIEKFKISEGGGIAVLHFDQHDDIPVDPETAQFLKQLNRQQSLTEVFQSLNESNIIFSIEKSLEMLHFFANQGMMKNKKDFLRTAEDIKGHSVDRPQTDQFDKSYFSKERMIALIQKTTLFMKCDRSVAEKILSYAKLEKVETGVDLIKKGTTSADFFVVLTGEVSVFREGEMLASLGSLAVFGESAAIFNKVRNADVRVTESAWVLRIDASQLVNTNEPESFDSYKGLKSRLILNQTLSANPIFRNLPADVLQLFISKCRIEKYSREQLIVEQGETSGDFYFILQGSVSIIKDQTPVTSLSEGNHFGEVAAIFHQPRNASVMTETKCAFLVLSQKNLMEVMISHFRLGIDIERTAKIRKHSTSNILQIFEDDESWEDENTQIVSMDDLTGSRIVIDEDLLEASKSNFELELVDFSEYSADPDEEASWEITFDIQLLHQFLKGEHFSRLHFNI